MRRACRFLGRANRCLSNRVNPTFVCTSSLSRRRWFSLPPHEIVGMPALSPSVERSKIVEWKKSEGDAVRADEAIAVVQTDKAELDWRVVDDIYLAKILLGAGIEADVNSPVAVFVEDAKDVAAFANFSMDGTGDAAPQEAAAAPTPTPTTSAPSLSISCDYEVQGIPALSPTATDGAIVEWMVSEGDFVSEGTEIAQIQTDKSTVAWAAIDDGYIAKLLYPADANNKLPVNSPALVLVDKEKDVAEIQAIDASLFISGGDSQPAPVPKTEKEDSATTTLVSEEDSGRKPSIQFRHGERAVSGGRIIASPLAKKLAAEKGVDLSLIEQGSGDRGRITAADVHRAAVAKPAAVSGESAAAPKATTTAVAGSTPVVGSTPLFATDRTFVDEPASTMRQVIAERLSESARTSPHYYVSVDCELDNLLALRSQMNDDTVKISVNDFIIKAAAMALRQVPDANVSWMGDTLRRYNYVDISVAVATPSGLITPIITDADVRSLSDISKNVKELAVRAKDNQLLPHEFQGGTLTISNMGMFGVKTFTAIINPPQSCIIAVGGARKELKADASDPRGFKEVTLMDCTVSSDHRSVDGAMAAQYMDAFRKFIEEPAKMLR